MEEDSLLLSTDNESSHLTFLYEPYPPARFYTNGLFAGIFILAGVVANIVVITSWLCDRGRWLPLYFYFLAFASWNLTLLISTFLFFSLPALLKQPADQSTIACVPYFYVIGYTGANCCLTAVVWLMVVLTVERYVAVTRPFHTRVSSPRRRAKIISATLSITAILYNVPLVFELLITTGSSPAIETSTTSMATTAATGFDDSPPRQPDVIYYWTVETAPFRSNFYYQTIYRVIANLLFISLIPFLIISTLTTRIVFVVRRTNRERDFYRRAMAPPTMMATASTGLNAASSRSGGGGGSAMTLQVQTTASSAHHTASSAAAATYGNVLLTIFVVKFLVCYTLPFALNVLELLLPSKAFSTPALMWVTDVSDFLVIVDSVSNAFLYFSWRRRIRFYKKKRRTMPSGHSKDCSGTGDGAGGGGGGQSYLRGGGTGASSPCLSRTSSRREDAQQQLLKSLPSPPGARYYRDLAKSRESAKGARV